MKSADRFDSLIQFWAESYMLPVDLVKKQMLRESSANPKASSPSGAIGLMQLMPGTAKELGVNPYDSDDNIKGGCAYMEQKIVQVSRALSLLPTGKDAMTYRMALASYNCGFGYVKAALADLRARGAEITWPLFIESLQRVRLGPFKRRADWRQVDGYVQSILPPPVDV